MSDTPNDPTGGRIADIVNGHDVVLFMKGTPLFPQCGFSSRAIQILDTLAVIEREALSTANDVTDSLRSLVTTGKNVPLNVLNWCEQKLHVLVNETFGTTQTGQVLGNSHLKWPTRQGSLGRPFPGHRVSLLDTTGVPVQLGETGEICVNRVDQHGYPDPALFKTYWRQETATNEAFTGNWYRSGIFARQDEDGYFWQIDVHTQVN